MSAIWTQISFCNIRHLLKSLWFASTAIDRSTVQASQVNCFRNWKGKIIKLKIMRPALTCNSILMFFTFHLSATLCSTSLWYKSLNANTISSQSCHCVLSIIIWRKHGILLDHLKQVLRQHQQHFIVVSSSFFLLFLNSKDSITKLIVFF